MQKIDGMTVREQSRWLALIQAMRCIMDGCKNRKLSFDAIDINPNYVADYIDNVSIVYEQQLQKRQKRKIQIIDYQLKSEFIKKISKHDLYC